MIDVSNVELNVTVNGVKKLPYSGTGAAADQYRRNQCILTGPCQHPGGENLGVVLVALEFVAFVQDQNLLGFFRANFSQNPIDLGHVRARVFSGDIDDVQNQIGTRDFLQRGAEGFDEGGGQIAHKTDGVAQENAAAGGQLEGANSGIESGKEARVREDASGAKAVEQGGLTGVGVAGE